MTYRIIYSLYFELHPEGLESSDAIRCLHVPLSRNGLPVNPYRTKNGHPNAPKKRTIDLRVGDRIYCDGVARTIKTIEVSGENWLTENDLKSYAGSGYIYRLRNEKRTPTEIRESRLSERRDMEKYGWYRL